MMKRQLFTFIVAITAILAGCSGEDIPTELSEPKEILFSVTELGVESRTGISTANLSNFGISISNPVSSQYTYNNIKVEKSSSDGKWTPAEQMLWHNLTDTVDIVACAPYSSTVGNLCGVSNYAVSVEENQLKGIDNSDFLVFKKSALVPKTDLKNDGTLEMEFKHVMCKLNIIVKLAESTELDYLKICGAKLHGQCNFTADEPIVVATGENTRDLKTKIETTMTSKAHCSCIMIPQTTESSGAPANACGLGIDSR